MTPQKLAGQGSGAGALQSHTLATEHIDTRVEQRGIKNNAKRDYMRHLWH